MNLDDLEDLATKYRAELGEADREIRVCVATACHSSGAPGVIEALNAAAEPPAADGEHSCKVKGVGCMGLCSVGPMVAVAEPSADLRESTLYREVAPDDAGVLAHDPALASEEGHVARAS